LSIAVVILNYQGRTLLEKYLPGIIKYLPENSTLHIADNGSTDESIAFLKDHYPTIPVIELNQNYGFAEGYNRALTVIKADYYALINSDILVDKDWLSPIISLMDQNGRIAACQPKIKSINEPDKFEYAGAAGGWIDWLGYPFCKGRILNTIEFDNGQYDQVEEIFWASGAAMVVRSKSFWEVGGFDPHFFAHMEEIDLCYRLKKYGYSVFVHGKVEVYHLGGGTLSYASDQKLYLNFRNNLLLLLKNKSLLSAIIVVPLRMIMDGLAGLVFLVQGKQPQFRAVINAHLDFYKMFSTALRHRKEIEAKTANRKMNKAGIYKGSIVIQYFLLGNRIFQVLKKGQSQKY